ncbi:MAG: sulfatase [Myxococcota bacterium]|nr:sulfatase [Myxococcota bacterium]
MYRTFGRRAESAGFVVAVAATALAAAACHDGSGELSPQRPNILFVVWDTVRADRMSLYGHRRETTPKVDAWAQQALVFDDAISAAGYTVPSHASMFTGLLPSEHCTSGEASTLGEEHTTLAELLRDAGYATFLYSENPHLSSHRRLTQGFERSEHPWSDRYFERALQILKQKVRGDRSSELGERVAAMERGESELTPWNVKAAGSLAGEALLDFLDELDPGRPFFAFINYMEAHRPYIPPRRFRERFMTSVEVEASYAVDRSWDAIWEFTFGARELSDEDLMLTRATYDAALLELDDLFASLLDSLERRGVLDDTIVVLTADHGEHLGEQHMFDHQSTLYQPALRVPLVLYHRDLLPAARSATPVMNFDLFPTLLELADVSVPENLHVSARSLLAPSAERERLAESITAQSAGVIAMRRLHPGWDPTAWIRTQRALFRGRYKWIASSTGANELYDLRADPGELHDVASLREIDAASMRAALERATSKLVACSGGGAPAVDERERELLQQLGYESSSEGEESSNSEQRAGSR